MCLGVNITDDDASAFAFHSVMMSILFDHYKQLMELKGMKNILLPKNRPEFKAIRPEDTLDRYCST
jgi:hypothetical protein